MHKTCYYHSRLKEDTVDAATKSLSLQDALELFRPDFISRSQCRLKKLVHRARARRAHGDSGPGPVHGLGEDRGRHRRNCTTPDPLSDNLFKPRERTISGREMQLRSRRIYNNLPEVTKRREEEKRRAVSQTNRLRAEVFKKKLLDQVLQR
ncbi:(E2-independent) E3 ubiquitin-conjugating enzyme FATS [Eucyclogobius newberryi]|uniref:(E2-independent) E3 ubiquitin-conjugating enzyme FATS n=1 Tax=Eucyclogobius newberryi TaxID=166745 RepID=UPI003B5B1E17